MESKTNPRAAATQPDPMLAAERAESYINRAEGERRRDAAAAEKAELENAAMAAEHERKGKSEQEEKAERDRLAADRPLKLYKVSAKDPQEPPFHFSNTAHAYIILARSEKEARHIAAGAHVGDMAGAWEDDKLSLCFELFPDKPGVVARGRPPSLDKPGVVARDMGA